MCNLKSIRKAGKHRDRMWEIYIEQENNKRKRYPDVKMQGFASAAVGRRIWKQ